MKKTFFTSLGLLSVLTLTGICSNQSVQAKEIINSTQNQQIQILNQNENKDEFTETSPENIKKLKEIIKNRNNKSLSRRKRSAGLSSALAGALNDAGFNHAAYLLDYSMRPLRKEPLVISDSSSFSTDIWTNSPDFRNKMRSFLAEARNSGSHSYFGTSTMTFNMPSGSKASILGSYSKKKQADLFGALHAVNIDIGVVKEGNAWDVVANIRDLYDFKKSQYNSLTNIVNAIAYHDQELGRVKPYNVEIYTYNRSYGMLPFGVTPW